MKKKSSIAISLLLISLTFSILLVQIGAFSEPVLEWDRTYGGTNMDGATSVVQTLDDGYAVVGITRSFGAGGLDFWLVKTDSGGNAEWSKTYGGTSDDHAASIVQTDDRGYAIAGHTYSFGAGWADFWLVKTDEFGNMEWSKTYGEASFDAAWSLVQTDDGGFALAGQLSWNDAWLVKTDQFGNMEWNKTYHRGNYDPLHSVIQTSDGGYALAGRTASQRAFSDGDFWLIKTDPSGIMQWDRTYGGSGEETAHMIVQTVEGGYALTGLTNSFGGGGFDTWLIKTDANGGMEWNKAYGGINDDWAHFIVQTGDEGYALVGYSLSFGAGAADFWLVKTDNLGNMEWNETYGGTNEDIAYSFVHTSDGGYALAGFTESFGAGNRDFWLIKLALPMIHATIDINPNTLNLRSHGEWITVYIELPEGYDVNDIDVSSIMLNGTVPAEPTPTAIGDYDGDGVPDLMVKFDRAAVSGLILSQDITSGNVVLTITGRLCDGTIFEGSDTIRVMLPMPKSCRTVPI